MQKSSARGPNRGPRLRLHVKDCSLSSLRLACFLACLLACPLKPLTEQQHTARCTLVTMLPRARSASCRCAALGFSSRLLGPRITEPRARSTPPKSPILFESPARDVDPAEVTPAKALREATLRHKAQPQPPPFTEPVTKMRRKRSVTLDEALDMPAQVDALVKAVDGTSLFVGGFGAGLPPTQSTSASSYPYQASSAFAPWTATEYGSGLVYPISSSRPTLPCDPSQFPAAAPWVMHDAVLDSAAPYLSFGGYPHFAGFSESSSSSSSASVTTSPPPPTSLGLDLPYGLAHGSAFSSPVNWLASGYALPLASPPLVLPPPVGPAPYARGTTLPYVGSASKRSTPASKGSAKSPRWGVLRQQIQDGLHPKSRGTCKFFNPQTVSFSLACHARCSAELRLQLAGLWLHHRRPRRGACDRWCVALLSVPSRTS